MNASEWNQQAWQLIRNAVLAPSSHNTQPWFFRISKSVIDLYADRTRRLPVNDPEDRELTISCGCALMNLRVAAASQDICLQVQHFPAPEEPDWLARVSFTNESGAPAAEGTLAEFVEHRRTYRKRFMSREVESAALNQLVHAAKIEGVWLRAIQDDKTLRQLAKLVLEGDAAQWMDSSWRRELAAWLHPRRRGDGLSVPALLAPVAQVVVRGFDLGRTIGAKDEELAGTSPLLVVLGTTRDDAAEWLLAGQALQRVLLTACKHGLQASYLNQPVQVATLRSKLQSLAGSGFPQIVLRLGHPLSRVAAAPRRKVEAVIDETA